MRPCVGVVYDEGSAGPGEIAVAARGCEADVFLVVDTASAHVARLAAGLGRRFDLLDITGLTPEAAAAQVCARSPDGMLTFSEHRMAATSEYAAAAGVKRWHTPETTRLLTDKYLQRRALADAGVDTMPCVLVPVGGAARAVAEVGLPAVLKPRQGTGSSHVRPVRTVEAAVAAADEYHRTGPQGTDLLAEPLLVGDPDTAGSPWGDYVSVETAVRDGDCRPVCVTGKFSLAEPFRERGSFVPHTLDDRTAERVTALAEAAIGALGVRDGVVHTELKLTGRGPRVIEVNGRVGGLVADLLRRGGDYDLVGTAMRLALGLPLDTAPVFGGVAYQYTLLAPVAATSLVGFGGPDRLRAVPGVDLVDVRATPGQSVDWRAGATGRLGRLHGQVPDHATLERTARAIETAFDAVYTTDGAVR